MLTHQTAGAPQFVFIVGVANIVIIVITIIIVGVYSNAVCIGQWTVWDCNLFDRMHFMEHYSINSFNYEF